jgi:Uma2 family endonuclease
MATTTQLLTVEELQRMPEDGNHYELVRGELRSMPPPGFRHGRISARFTGALVPYVETNKLGVVLSGDPGFVLARDPDIVRAPDVAFVSAARIAASGEPTGYWEGAPDLAVEVLSPNDTVFDVEEKTNDWLTLGCRMVVLVNDRRRTVTVHRPGVPPRILHEDEVFDGEDVVPGFRLPLKQIFA